ncbi:hypothetical protein [Uliginosibacterium sediminicola]|uniref:hypothetical protein n=1 Tax=Uliginosibacterium sediminicola TaxID=2024550 RepID=UPI0031F6CF0F
MRRYRSTSFLVLLCCLLWFGRQAAPLHALTHALADLHVPLSAAAEHAPESPSHGRAACEQCLVFSDWNAALPALLRVALLSACFALLAQRVPDSRYQVLRRAYLSRAPPIHLV